MKDKIFDFLRNNYSKLGLSKDILDGWSDIIASQINSEEGIADAVKAIEPMLIIQQKENDRLRGEIAKKAAEQPQPTPQPNGKEREKQQELPDWAKALVDDVKGLRKSLKDKDHYSEIAARRKEVGELISKLPKSVQAAYNRMDLDIPEEDYANLKTQVTAEVNDAMNELNVNGAAFGAPRAGNGGKGELSKEDAKDIVKNLHV